MKNKWWLQPEYYTDFLDVLNQIFTYFFLVECTLKLGAFRIKVRQAGGLSVKIEMARKQGGGTQPPSLPLSLSQLVLWYGESIAPILLSPHPASLLEYQAFRQTISYAPDFTVVNYWQKLPANPAQISTAGGKIVHHTQYTQFSWPLLRLVVI
jgi:hypothetical protein